MLSVRPEPAARGAEISYDTIADGAAFERLGDEWDDLVRAMPRPSPYMLHAWLETWWHHFSSGRTLCVHTARVDGQLVGALPLCIEERGIVRKLQFIGADRSTLADLLVSEAAPAAVGPSLVERAADSGQHVADLFGLPGDSRLAGLADSRDLRFVARLEAPVLDLEGGWDAVYSEKTTSKKRNLHHRRRRQLAAQGTLECSVARSEPELMRALEHAFALHARRWHGRPDTSGFVSARGRAFEQAALRALAANGVPRIVLLSLDGRPVAFSYFFIVEQRMYMHRLAFDPMYAAYSPGLLNVLDALSSASKEGVAKVEFLGGAERFKRELSDRFEPIYEAIGLASGAVGSLARDARIASIRLRLRLKRSPSVNWLHYRGAAPARRALARVRRTRHPVGRARA